MECLQILVNANGMESSKRAIRAMRMDRVCASKVLRLMLATMVTMMTTTAAAAPRPLANLLFLMSDSFDGRFLDPKAPQWSQVELPHLRSLAKRSTNFVRTYANSPQCVPSRSSMMTGRHTHHIGAWSNSMGLAHRLNSSAARVHSCEFAWNVSACEAMLADKDDGHVDKQCKADWNQSICHQIERWQPGVSDATPDVLRALRNAGVDVHVFGKVDIGFGFLEEL